MTKTGKTGSRVFKELFVCKKKGRNWGVKNKSGNKMGRKKRKERGVTIIATSSRSTGLARSISFSLAMDNVIFQIGTIPGTP